MFTRQTDTIGNAVRLLVAMGGFASAPGPRSGVAAYDAIRRLATRPPASFALLAAELTEAARATFTGFRDAPPDADVLFAQMTETGLLTPAEITAAGMDPTACTAAMQGKLWNPAHTTGEMPRLFAAITTTALARLLASPEIAADLTPAFMADILQTTHRIEGRVDDVAGKLDNLEAQTRDTLDALALRFGEPEPERLSLAELRAFLVEKARDYRALCAEVEALRGATPRIDNVLSAVEAAIETLDLEEADRLLASLRETTAETLRKPLEDNAKVIEAQARVALLRGDPEAAYRLLSAAADSFAGIDPVEPARRRLSFGYLLQARALRYGGDGLGFAARMYSDALSRLNRGRDPKLRIGLASNLGNALQEEGLRVGGEQGFRLLVSAREMQESALHVAKENFAPADWGIISSNLGNTLKHLGVWAGGEVGVRLLAEAADAQRIALSAHTELDHPVDWAMDHLALAGVSREQGRRSADEKRDRYFADAVDGCREALRVLDEVDHPSDWVNTQLTLGNTLADQAVPKGDASLRLLTEAVEAFRAALRIYNEADFPKDWAQTKNSLGTALWQQSEATGGATGACFLAEAMEAYHAALRVRTEAEHPVDWAMTMENLGLAHEAMAGNETCDPRAGLERAAECVAAALRVFDPEHMRSNFDKATASLERIRNKLAGLG